MPSLLQQAFNRLPELPDIDIDIEPEVFLAITGWSTQSAPNETAGHGILVDGVVVWACRASIDTASSGFVKSGSSESVIAALQAGYDADAINMQWHTHPSFGAFHSGTDIDNEMRIVQPLAKQKPHGSFYFIVASAYDWCVRKYIWYDHVLLGYQEGTVLVPDYGIKLNQGRHKSVTVTNQYGAANKKAKETTVLDEKPEKWWEDEGPDKFSIFINDEWISVVYDADQPPPKVISWTQEVDCLPLFKAFGVEPFKWNELESVVWDKTANREGNGDVTKKPDEAPILLKIIIEEFLKDASILEDVIPSESVVVVQEV